MGCSHEPSTHAEWVRHIFRVALYNIPFILIRHQRKFSQLLQRIAKCYIMSSMTMLSSNALASNRCNVGKARPTSALRNQPFTPRPLRRTVQVRADKESGPVGEAVKAAKDFQDTVEEKAQVRSFCV